jgi:hypothetical protein
MKFILLSIISFTLTAHGATYWLIDKNVDGVGSKPKVGSVNNSVFATDGSGGLIMTPVLSLAGNLTSGPVTASGGVSAIADGAITPAKISGVALTQSSFGTGANQFPRYTAAPIDDEKFLTTDGLGNLGEELKSNYLTTADAASTYAPVSTTVTLDGVQTLTNKTLDGGTLDAVTLANTIDVAGSGIFSYAGGSAAAHWTALGGGGTIGSPTFSSIPSPGAIGGTTPAAISATTVTASGAVTLTAGNICDVIESGSAKIRIQNGDVQYYNSSGNRKLLLGSNGIGLALTSDYSITWSSSSTEAYSPRDVRIRRTGTNTITVDNNSGGAGNMAITGTLAVTGASTFSGGAAIPLNGTSLTVGTGSASDVFISFAGGRGVVGYNNTSNYTYLGNTAAKDVVIGNATAGVVARFATTGATTLSSHLTAAGNIEAGGDITSGATVFSVDGEFSGTVMTDLLMASGKISASIPNYANDAAADADVNLLSGQLYRTGGGRTVYQKP